MGTEPFRLKWVRVQENLPMSELRDCVLRYDLPLEWVDEAVRYGQAADRWRFLAGRRLRLEYLRMYEIASERWREFEVDEFGRPYFPGGPDFNISHSGGWIGMVTHAEHRVGFDVEKHREIDPGLFSRQFSAMELMHIQHAEDEKRAFFDSWSKKEAVMKADGRGMRIPLHSIVLNEAGAALAEEQWHCRTVNPTGDSRATFVDYSAHLCSRVAIKNWESEVELW
ncbi:MAG: 4'-phosphopantetheinyl transferase family protein [Flavobacteriales bacterium]